MTTPTRIELIVEGEFPCRGEIEVTQLGSNRFRLEKGAFLMFDGGLHDIIEADLQHSGAYLLRGVVEQSSWQRFDFLLSQEQAVSDAFKEQLFVAVENLGGRWETMFGGLVSLYLPQDIPFDLQKQIASIAEQLRSDPQAADGSGTRFLGEQRLITFDLSGGISPKKE